MKAVAERLWGKPSLSGRHVCISGVGKVGGALAEHLRGAGEPHAAAVALHDRLADLALERGELLRDGRRREVERVGGRRDGAVLGDLAQDAQAAGIDHAADLTDRSRNVYWL